MERKNALMVIMMVTIFSIGLTSIPAYAAFLTPVQIIDATGDESGNTLDKVEGVATDSLGNVFVTGAFSDNVFKITPGGIITEIINSTGDRGGNTLDSAHAVATDSSGNVFVSAKDSRNVFKIATPGTCKTSGGTPCTITEIIDFIEPHGIATDSSGNVFVQGKDGDVVLKIATPGTCKTSGGTLCTITQIIGIAGDGTNNLIFPHGIATDSSGNVFVSGITTNNVFKITPGGTITEIINATGDGTNTLDDPRNIATDSSGNVFVVGKNTNNAFKIATPGTCSTGGTPCTITEIINSTGDGGWNPLKEPQGVATDSSGNVFVIGDMSHNAFKIATPGTCKTSGGTPCTITEIIDSTGDGVGNPLDEPFDVATDSSGNVFVTGRVSDNAFKIIKDKPIGGTVGSIDTVSLLVAGAQGNMGWWSLALVGVVAAGAAIIYKAKSKKTEQ